MKKYFVVTTIIIGLSLIALSFQNCGPQAQFKNDDAITQNLLLNKIGNDSSIIATENQKREVLVEMDLVMNQDPRTVEEPLEDVMDQDEETGKVTLRKESETYLCKSDNAEEAAKYMLCHVPSDSYDMAATICLEERDLKAHLKHLQKESPNSYMGPCK